MRHGLWLGFESEHVLKVCDLFGVLSELDILQVLNLFLSQQQLILALLIGLSQLLLEMFHLLNEDLLIFEPLL